MAKQTEYSWDSYVAEARVEPFRLRVSDDEVIEIAPPTANALMRIMQGQRSGDLELIIHAIAGDHWDRLRELFGDPASSHKILGKIVEDMLDHFEFYEDVTLVGPSGGTVKRRRPSEIGVLLEQGYRPAGEGRASSA